jgi:5'-phosphate synthase pdxT subunit
MTKSLKTIGVLALQGAFVEHGKMLEKLGCKVVYIRTPKDAVGVEACVIPGGESTTMKSLMKQTGLDEWLIDKGESGLPIFGTCAGVIILKNLGLLNIDVERNAYGRQLDSFETVVSCKLSVVRPDIFNGIFIRAPKIISVGNGVEVLAKYKNNPVLIRQKNILGATFHPELANDTAIHEYFLKM